MAVPHAAAQPEDAARTAPRWVWVCVGLVVAGIAVAVAAPSVFTSETTGIVVSSASGAVATFSLFAIAAWGLGILFYEATKNG
jgi:hypothetical protein